MENRREKNLNLYPLTTFELNFQLLVIAPLHTLFNIFYLPFYEFNILECDKNSMIQKDTSVATLQCTKKIRKKKLYLGK